MHFKFENASRIPLSEFVKAPSSPDDRIAWIFEKRITLHSMPAFNAFAKTSLPLWPLLLLFTMHDAWKQNPCTQTFLQVSWKFIHRYSSQFDKFPLLFFPMAFEKLQFFAIIFQVWVSPRAAQNGSDLRNLKMEPQGQILGFAAHRRVKEG